jgi:hypothetical protein
MEERIIPFFATAGDLASMLSIVEATRPLEFAIAGMFEEAPASVLRDVDGRNPFTTYLVFDQGRGIKSRPVLQRHGGTRYAVDQTENPHTVALQNGGAVDDSRLIASQLGTISTDPVSEQLYSLFNEVIRSRFEKIQSYYVGPEAARLLDSGRRLVPSVRAPPTYDLARA